MPRPSRSRARAVVEDAYDDGDRAYFFQRLPRKDLFALIAATLACSAIGINALLLQKGMHPAPIFVNKPARIVAPEKSNNFAPIAVALPRARPVESEAVKLDTAKSDGGKSDSPPRARPRAEIIADIQKELLHRRFYDGPTDGMYGPKTDAAIRDFEQATFLKIGSQPDEALLQTILHSPAKAAKAVSVPDAPRPPDPIAEMIAPSKKVLAVQRVLTEYGYGQIKPSGVLDNDTQNAIEQFERARNIPITGQISPRLMRELAALTGRPLD